MELKIVTKWFRLELDTFENGTYIRINKKEWWFD